jgi:hypothetical protein
MTNMPCQLIKPAAHATGDGRTRRTGSKGKVAGTAILSSPRDDGIVVVHERDDLPPALTNLSTTGVLRHETFHALHGWIAPSISAGLIVVSAISIGP